MQLNDGICTVYIVADDPDASMPTDVLTLLAQMWYAEMSFASAPVFQTENREEVQIDRKIRVLQNRAISPRCVVLADNVQYKVIKAYHGIDKESGERISDLYLQEVTANYDFA